MGPHLMSLRLRSTFAPGFMSMAVAPIQSTEARSTSRTSLINGCIDNLSVRTPYPSHLKGTYATQTLKLIGRARG